MSPETGKARKKLWKLRIFQVARNEKLEQKKHKNFAFSKSPETGNAKKLWKFRIFQVARKWKSKKASNFCEFGRKNVEISANYFWEKLRKSVEIFCELLPKKLQKNVEPLRIWVKKRRISLRIIAKKSIKIFRFWVVAKN